MRQRRAIVTGGAGFIGSHVVDLLLEEDFEVRVIDNLSTGRSENISQHAANHKLIFHEMDMCTLQPGASIFKDVDYLFHFGGLGDIVPSIENPHGYMKANVDGTLAVVEGARHAGVHRIVYAASSSCYGVAAETPTTESALIQTEYPYALSKYLGECIMLHWAKVYKMGVVSLRIFNAYGPRVRTTGVYGAVFGVFLAQKLKGLPFTVVGDGTQRRDFVYVTDVAKAFYKAAESNDTGEVFNLGAGNPQSINRLIELLEGEKVYVPKRPGEPDCTWADITKIQKHLGWKTQVSFEDGVSNMLDFIEDWSNAPLWTPEKIENATETWFKFLSPS